MAKDPWDDPRVQQWMKHCREELKPMIDKSAVTIALMPEEPDVRTAVELGYSILLGKPIIVFAPPGRLVPLQLRRVADAVIIGEPTDPLARMELEEALIKLGLGRD